MPSDEAELSELGVDSLDIFGWASITILRIFDFLSLFFAVVLILTS